MSTNDTRSSQDSADKPDVSEAIAATETYETDEGVVFYDAENPLAWLQSRETITLDEMA